MKSVSSGKLRKVANETHTQGRSCPDSIGSPGVRGSAPGVELDVRSARLRRSPGSTRADGVQGDPQVERSGP